MKYLFISLLFMSLFAKSSLYYIEKYCGKYNLDARIIKALIQVESNGKLNAESSKNAYGLMQIKLITARSYYLYRFKKDNVKWGLFWNRAPDKILKYHIKIKHVNIQIGCWYMRQCLNYYNGNYLQALNGYINGCHGGKTSQSWNYIFNIINKIINLK